jgi:hypothetical protein
MAHERIQPPKDEALYLRISAEELERIREAAQAAGADSVAAWCRRVLAVAAGKALR